MTRRRRPILRALPLFNVQSGTLPADLTRDWKRTPKNRCPHCGAFMEPGAPLLP